MPRLSSLITKGLNTPYVEPGYWHIPTGAVIIYGGSSDPGLTGWTRYSEADGYYIKGTTTQGEIGTTSAGNNASITGVQQSASTGTNGAHNGSGVSAAQTYFNGSSLRTNYGVAGAHIHTLTYTIGAGTDINPASSNVVLLKATQEQKYFPANTWQMSGTQIPGSSQVTATSTKRYIRGAATKTDTEATARDFSATTDLVGFHTHQSAYTNNAGPQSNPGGAGTWTTQSYYLEGGTTPSGTAHTHTVAATISTDTLDGKLLKLWSLASEIVPENNVIIMFTGNIADLRDYWKVCDGTNGTPDMRGYFLGYSNLSATAHDTTTTYATSIGGGSTMSTNNWSHGHLSNPYTGTGYPRPIYHTPGTQAHSHTFSTPSSVSFQPAEIKLCFIQLIKTA